MTATTAQLHELPTYCMEFAQTMLSDADDFLPFGAILSTDGEVVAVGGYDGNEKPAPQDIYRLLAEAFVSETKTGNTSAVALAANVNVPEKYKSLSKDALRVHLETQGFARFIYVPYEIATSGIFKKKRSPIMHEPISVDVDPSFFMPVST